MTSDHLQGDLDIFGYRPATKFGYIQATCLNNCVETWQFFVKMLKKFWPDFLGKKGNTRKNIILFETKFAPKKTKTECSWYA